MRKQALWICVEREFQTEERSGAKTLRLLFDGHVPVRAGVESAKGRVVGHEIREMVREV